MKEVGRDEPLNIQVEILHNILKQNKELYEIIEETKQFAFSEYYIGGGSITQTVWNYLLDKPLEYGISDVDIVYYDSDLSESKEINIIHSVKSNFSNKLYEVDIANEARVHLWYEKAFGKVISPYYSVEEAISTWPTTATSLGVRLEQNELVVFAPYGLNDLYNLTVKPNKKMIDKTIYDKKVKKWQQKWPAIDYKKW